jgi:hypothetical protein
MDGLQTKHLAEMRANPVFDLSEIHIAYYAHVLGCRRSGFDVVLMSERPGLRAGSD